MPLFLETGLNQGVAGANALAQNCCHWAKVKLVDLCALCSNMNVVYRYPLYLNMVPFTDSIVSASLAYDKTTFNQSSYLCPRHGFRGMAHRL
jgi:hypothetical protein